MHNIYPCFTKLFVFRFSNLEILAKMEQEMATRMEKEGLNTGEGQGEDNIGGPGITKEIEG